MSSGGTPWSAAPWVGPRGGSPAWAGAGGNSSIARERYVVGVFAWTAERSWGNGSDCPPVMVRPVPELEELPQGVPPNAVPPCRPSQTTRP